MLENVERINQWFRHVGEIILKGRWGIIIALLVINVFAIGESFKPGGVVWIRIQSV